MKSKFLQTCIGIAIVLVALAFFITPFTNAKAESFPDINSLQSGNNTFGKYQITAFIDRGDNSFAEYAIIIDTETGETRSYVCSKNNSWKWKLEKEQIPANPFGN